MHYASSTIYFFVCIHYIFTLIFLFFFFFPIEPLILLSGKDEKVDDGTYAAAEQGSVVENFCSTGDVLISRVTCNDNLTRPVSLGLKSTLHHCVEGFFLGN